MLPYSLNSKILSQNNRQGTCLSGISKMFIFINFSFDLDDHCFDCKNFFFVFQDLVVNHVHPGWVDTDMTSHKGPLTPEEGARSSIFAALLPPQTPIKGQYIWKDCSVIDWTNESLPAPV